MRLHWIKLEQFKVVSFLDEYMNAGAKSSSKLQPESAPSGSPGKLDVRHKLPTTAELSWSPVLVEKQNGVITGYTVKIVGPNSPGTITVQGAGATSVEIPGLRPFTSYTFSVSSMTKAGTGPGATISSITPEGAPYGSPVGVSIKHKLPTTVDLNWSPVPLEKWNGNITGYTVKIVGRDSPGEISVQGAATTSVVIPGLRPFTRYTFSVSAMTKAGTGPAATISSITPEGVPSGSPVGLSVGHKLPKTAELSWSPVPVEKQNGIIRYSVEVVGPGSSRDIFGLDGDTTGIKIPGLRHFTSYLFNVSAVTKAGTGPAATISSKTPEGAPSGGPGGLSVEHKLPSTAELSWSPVPVEKQNGVITGYTVKVAGPDSPGEIPVQGAGTISVEIPGLRPFTLYTFNVSAMTKAGTGPAATISSKTPEGAPSVAPRKLNVSHSLSTTANLSWSLVPLEKQNGIITGYTVQIVGPDSPQVIPVQGALTTSVDIPCLKPFTSYTFKVSAMTKAGTGPTATISSKTPEGVPCGSPGGLSVKYALPTTVELCWSPLPVEKQNGVITGYTVKVVGPDSPEKIPMQGAGTTSVEIPGLKPSTSYIFSVSAITKAGTGPAATISSTTPEGESGMVPLAKDSYMCANTSNSHCLVYLPEDVNEKVSIETVTDASIHPKIASYEIFVSPIVRIAPNTPNLLLKKPAIIELTKNIELSDEDLADNEVIPVFANSESSEWKDLGSECNCRTLNDRISFEVPHFSLYAVISCKPYPKSTVKVKPSVNTSASDHPSTPTILTIPALKGFKVQVPPANVDVNQLEEIDVTATVLYDCPMVCSEDERSRLASSCIELEPHGITFTKAVSISIPIPDYAEVIKNDPDAQLQILWYSNDCTDNGNNEPIKHNVCQDEEGQYVAIVQTNHFSILKPIWLKHVTSQLKELFNPSFKIKARCQVFMSQETPFKSQLTFSIAVLFYPYKNRPHPIPHNYKHMLTDGEVDLKVSNKDTIQFKVELNEQLSPNKCKPIAGLFAISGGSQKSFNVELDMENIPELPVGLPIGELSIGPKEGTEENKCTLSLIKPRAYEFDESIIKLKAAAERLDREVSQHEDNPGPMVEAAKKIASMWKKMGDLVMKEFVHKQRKIKKDILDLAKSINKESQKVVNSATSTAEACTDKIMKRDVDAVVARIQTISHQLNHLARQEATRQRDDATDFEACQMLTKNAENLSSAISEALHRIKSASLRVTEKKLSQTPPDSESLSSQHQQAPVCTIAPPTTPGQPMSLTADKKINLEEIPTLDELMILKYTDKGERKKVRIINEARHMWKDIANLICDDANIANVLEEKYRGDSKESLKQTFIDNFINKKPKNYSQDWNGLIELLDDVGLETLAKNVKHALSC